MNMKERFTYVYDNDVWGGSGGGSNPQFLGEYFKWLNLFINQKRVQKVLDFGCGLSGSGQLLHVPMYYGMDAVDSVIEHCRINYSSPTRKYFVGTLPPTELAMDVDMIIVKDVLMHWSYEEIEAFLNGLWTFKYIVLVNSCQQTEDYQKCSENPHLQATPLSHKFLPLAKYSPELIMTLNVNPNDPKEVLLITNNNL